MNEEALKYSFDLFVKDGYNGTIDDYKELVKTDDKARSVSYNLFTRDGYNGSDADFNNLMGIDNTIMLSDEELGKTNDSVKADPSAESNVMGSELAEPLSAWQSIKNSFSNLGEQLYDVKEFYFDDDGANSSFDIATNAVYSMTMGGQAKVDEYVSKNLDDPMSIEGLGTEKTLSAIKKHKKEKEQAERTLGIIESAKEGDIGGILAGTVNAITSMIGSVGYNLSTIGTGFFFDYAADNYIAFNEMKAKNLGITLDELIKSGQADAGIPVGMAAVSQGLELFGLGTLLKGAKGAIKGTGGASLSSMGSKYLAEKLIYNKGARSTMNILATGATEFSTEILQHAADEVNKEFGSVAGTENKAEVGKAFIDAITSQEGLEAGLQGFIGGSGMTAGAYSVKAMNTIRTVVDSEAVEKKLNDLSKLHAAKREATDNTVIAGLQKQIDAKDSEIADSIVNGNDIYNSLEEGDINKIENLSDLYDAAAYQVTELNKKLRRGDINQKEYDLGKIGFEIELDKAKEQLVEMELGKNLKVAESIAKDKNLGLDVMSSLEVEDLMNSDKVKEKQKKQYYDQKKKGFEISAFVVGNKIVVDKDIAKKTGSINVGMHEVLHPVFNKLIGDNKAQGKMVKQFRRVMTSSQRRFVDAQMKKRGYTGKAYNTEYVNVFSDALRKKQINYDKTTFEKIGGTITSLFKPLGYTNIGFESGKDVYNFIKEFDQSAEQGKLTVKAAEALKNIDLSDAGIGDNDLQASQEVRDLTEALDAAEEAYAADPNDPTLEKKVELAEKALDEAEERALSGTPAIKPVVAKPKEEKKKVVKREPKPVRTTNLAPQTAQDKKIMDTYNEGMNDTKRTSFTSSNPLPAKVENKLIPLFEGYINTLVQQKFKQYQSEALEFQDALSILRVEAVNALRTFNPARNQNLSGYVRRLIALRQPKMFEKANKEFTSSLDDVDVAGDAGVIRNFADEKQIAPDKLVKASKVITPKVRADLANMLKTWASQNNIDFDTFRFGDVDANATVKIDGKDVKVLNEVLKELFPGVDPEKFLDSRTMFTSGEASTVLSKLAENDQELIELFINLLPRGAVMPKGKNKAMVKDDNYGKSTKLDGSILKNFYDKGTERFTKKAGLTPFILKDNIRYSDVHKAFGMDSSGNKLNYQRAKSGIVLSSAYKMLGKLIMNEVIRTDLGLTAEQKMNVGAGKSDLQFSKNASVFEALNVEGAENFRNIFVHQSEKYRKAGQDLLIELAYRFTPEEVRDYILPLISDVDGSNYDKEARLLFRNKDDFFRKLKKYGKSKFGDYKPRQQRISVEGGAELKLAKVTSEYYQGASFIENIKAFVKNIKDRQTFAKEQQKGLLKIVKTLSEILDETSSKKGIGFDGKSFENISLGIFAYFNYLNTKNKNGILRTSAVPTQMAIIPSKDTPVKYIYEHTQTASDTSGELMQLVFNKFAKNQKFGKNPNIEKEFKEIMDGYTVALIPKIYDTLLNAIAKENGDREGTKTRKDYIKKLLKPGKDGVPTRYKIPAFEKLLEENGLESLQDILTPIDQANYDATVRGRDAQFSMNRVEITEILNKANNNANNINAKPKGISVWDFDDTLAKTKSNVLYTMPGEIRIFHGGDVKSVKDIDGFVYFSEDKKQAAAYAKGNQGEVSSFKIDEASIATEDQVFDVINNLDIKPRAGYAVDESNLYELIDPRFEQSFSKKDLKKLAVALKRKGIKAARFTDTNISQGKNEGRETENIVVFDKKVVQEQNKLDAEQFAKEGDRLMAEGVDFDFSEFSKVVNGSKGPFFEKAMARNKKFGNKNVFILTARPANSANAIHEFLKGIGLDIPLANITGLADSSPQAKADWVVGKAAEGYNDFYFADDAIQNVKAVAKALEVLDVKSKVRQANVQFSKSMNSEFNQMIEKKSGIDARGTISKYKASVMGRKKGRFQFFIPPGAEDFEGLMYKLLGKGKLGEQQKEWFKKSLFDPFARGINEFDTYKLQVANAVRQLKKSLKDIPKELGKRDPKTDFKYEDAVRVYLWQLNGHEIKGISESDIKTLVNIVKNSPNLKRFARQLNKTMGGYPAPQESWLAGTITTDAINMVNTIKRKEFLETWQQNADIIFSEDNLNKLEATFGEDYVEALKDSLYRMKSGRNRPVGANKLTNKFMNWVNDSVATIMFFNTRSALLQTLSTVNFINWGDNNPLLAAKAFGNQKQFWSDFSMLFNSDFLKSRRTGLKNDVNADEIANAAATQTNKAKAALAVLLKAGFLPTQIADSFAIAMGGASFYRNRVNTYMQKGEGKPGMGRLAAEEQAFLDFQEIAEATQQSSRPDRVSQQQASPLGRIILAFANTPMQYMRLTKKAFLDLKNGRGSAKENITKILYYAAIQNVIFSSLQAALFATLFDDEEEEETKKKGVRVANTMLDSMLRGLGIYGAVASTVKNIALEIDKQSKKDRPDYAEAAVKALDLSPPISSKIRKGRSAGRAFSYKNTREKMVGFGLDNPAYYAVGQITSATANIPLDRAVRKANHVRLAFAQETKFWQSVSLLLGFSEWDLNMIEKDKKKTKFGQKMKWKKRKLKKRKLK